MDNSSLPTLKNAKGEEDESLVGTKLTDFKILCELGRGSFGVVNKVLSLVDHNEYVMKKINMKHVKLKHQKEALKEAQILRRVKHPNIIRYYTSFVEEEYLYIIMEYAEGGDLAVLIKSHKERKKFFSEREIWDLGWELCQALDYLHNNNIIHRDIKTLNIFLSKDRHVKLGDLGVSKIVSSAASLQGTRVGTPLYLSPELVKQLPYDYKVDIWALGCVLYHLVSLEPPFYGDNLITLGYNIVHKFPKPLSNTYSPRLISIITKFLEKNASSRPKISDVYDLFPSRYKHISSSNNIKTSPTTTTMENQITTLGTQPTEKVDKVEAYKGFSARLFKDEKSNQNSERDRANSIKPSITSLSSMNDIPKNTSSPHRPSTALVVSSSKISNSIREREEPLSAIKKGETKLQYLLSEPTEGKPRKIVDTESTVEHKAKQVQGSLINLGGNDSTLSVKNVREVESNRKYKTKEANVIIEENFGEKKSTLDLKKLDPYTSPEPTPGNTPGILSPKVGFTNKAENRPMTSDSKRIGMNAIIKTSSPRVPIKARISSVFGVKPLIAEIPERETVPVKPEISHTNVNSNTNTPHNDIRIRPVSAHIIKRMNYIRPTIDIPSDGNGRDKSNPRNSGDFKVNESRDQDSELKPLPKSSAMERPKSAVFLNRLHNQVTKKVEFDTNVKVGDMLKNAYEMRKFDHNGEEKMRALIGASPIQDKRHISPIRKMNNNGSSGVEFIQEIERVDKEDIDPDGDYGAFSRGKKSQTWVRVEVVPRKTDPLGFSKQEKYGVIEANPGDILTRPQTSAGYKKKLTIHDMML
jgi:NIMA (never in mitosis gene a)-related kinase